MTGLPNSLGQELLRYRTEDTLNFSRLTMIYIQADIGLVLKKQKTKKQSLEIWLCAWHYCKSNWREMGFLIQNRRLRISVVLKVWLTQGFLKANSYNGWNSCYYLLPFFFLTPFLPFQSCLPFLYFISILKNFSEPGNII